MTGAELGSNVFTNGSEHGIDAAERKRLEAGRKLRALSDRLISAYFPNQGEHPNLTLPLRPIKLKQWFQRTSSPAPLPKMFNFDPKNFPKDGGVTIIIRTVTEELPEDKKERSYWTQAEREKGHRRVRGIELQVNKRYPGVDQFSVCLHIPIEWNDSRYHQSITDKIGSTASKRISKEGSEVETHETHTASLRLIKTYMEVLRFTLERGTSARPMQLVRKV